MRLRAVLPDLVNNAVDVRVTEVGSYLVVDMAMKHEDGEMWFDAARLSDGALRLLGILAAVHQWPRLPVVAIEEPELTVHPGVAGLLTDELVDAAHRMQVIVTTHSPDLIERMPLESLRVVELTGAGTKIGNVEPHQADMIQERLFSSGEFLRMHGLRRELKPTG